MISNVLFLQIGSRQLSKLIAYIFFLFLELLQLSNFDTREGKDLLRNVVQTFRDPNSEASFKFEKLELVSNDQLSKEVDKLYIPKTSD